MLFAVVLKAVFVTTLVVGVFAPLLVWSERRQGALMQDRLGWNRAAIGGATLGGLLHPLADLLKLLAKENVVPEGANRTLHALAPAVAVLPALISFAVIPWGGVYAFGEQGGRTLSLVVADLDWGLLYIFAVGSFGTYGVVLAGLSSASHWSLLGAIRAGAQMISVQVPLGLSVVGVFMVFGSLKLTDIAAAQDGTVPVFGFIETLGLAALPAFLDEYVRIPSWGIFLQPLGFVLFLACMTAQSGRPPFDSAESASELVAGYATEYSAMRLGLFRLADFVRVVVVSALVVGLFLGGWSVPYLPQDTIIGGALPLLGRSFAELLGTNAATLICMLLHVGSFAAKTVVVIWFQTLVSWSLPRLRSDQLMRLCWKGILPLAFANVFLTAAAMLVLGEA